VWAVGVLHADFVNLYLLYWHLKILTCAANSGKTRSLDVCLAADSTDKNCASVVARWMTPRYGAKAPPQSTCVPRKANIGKPPSECFLRALRIAKGSLARQ
jgi:hypothetical protein